ncbi:VPLPA-CTERM sorting domain-containing protein [Roseobacter sp. S98]|uniref:VPLPA-CTERM sorting domain-containing protein n=1 Tax=Roseobacter algicola (ex Choi et al. 2025) (nom. illeg.) TaxID=3092138 RepID=UPI003F5118F6
MKMIAIAAALAALSVSAVSAATTKIDFTAPDSHYWTWGETFDSEDGELSVDVTAHRYNSDTKEIGSRIWLGQWEGYGLGSCSSANRYGCTDNHRVDGSVKNDLIKLSFDQDVTLHEIEFGSFRSTNVRTVIDRRYVCGWYGCYYKNVYGTKTLVDNFDLFAGTPLEFLFMDDVQSTLALGENAPSASMFGIGAPAWDDAFKILSVTVKVNEVPLPATGLMLLAAVGGLAARKARKKA